MVRYGYIATSLVMCGCTHMAVGRVDVSTDTSDVRDVVIAEWAGTVGPLSSDCQDYLYATEITLCDKGQYYRHCPQGSVGCYADGLNAAWILYGESADEVVAYVTAHELLHAVAYCTIGDTDPTHSRTIIWDTIMGDIADMYYIID